MQHINRYDPYSRPSSSSFSSSQIPQKDPFMIAQSSLPYTTKPLDSYPIHNSHHIKTTTQIQESRPRTHSRSSSQSTGRYQPSRGAQRDAKYTKREAEKAEYTQHQTKATIAQLNRISASYSQDQIGVKPVPAANRIHNPYKKQINLPLINRSNTRSQDIDSDLENTEKIRKEQLIVIESARKAHLELQKKKDEEDKKIRRIQLQVFVHARPTHCEWSNCQAVLNSWATLEKHIHHSHLHPSFTPAHNVKCEWKGCNDFAARREDCERHILVGHMGTYSARCPFNCLYEGPSFSHLMAHISRRHPNATPDDFIPGLIHQKPTLPPLSSLPSLPSLDQPNTYHPFNPIKPFHGGIGNRNRKMVMRSCFKGKHPRVDAYEDKRGAGAAIKAIIENSKRLKQIQVPQNSNIDFKLEGKPDRIIINNEINEDVECGTTVELIDVLGSAKFATEKAKEELGYQSQSENENEDYTSLSSDSNSIEDSSRDDSSRYVSPINTVFHPETNSFIRESVTDITGSVRAKNSSTKRSERIRLKMIDRIGSGSSYSDSPYSEEC